MSAAPIIRVRDLKVAFGSSVVLEHLNLDIPKGEVVGVIGPSGCGKSVLLRAITGLKPPESGSVEVFGERLETLSRDERTAIERRWGIMFQDGALFSNLTVRENVMVPMKEHTQLSRPLMHDLADMKIRLSGLAASAGDKYPSDLSGGMRKRAALARALALDPELLFLDEPTAGLDPITAAAFDTLVRSLQRALGLTVFLVTHDVDTLYATCDRIVVLGEKKVLAVGTIPELREVDHPWIQEYFSGPRGRAAAPMTEEEA
jgi:phospholipid/cholesterol/gamma-HCH transport system ATP-binding protein